LIINSLIKVYKKNFKKYLTKSELKFLNKYSEGWL